MTLNRLAILAAQQPFDKPQVHALLQQAWHMAETSQDQRVLAETAWNHAQISAVVWDDPKHALLHGSLAFDLARGIYHQELDSISLCLLLCIHLNLGEFEKAMPFLEVSL